MERRRWEYGKRIYRVIINIATLSKIYSKRSKITYNSEIGKTQRIGFKALSVTWGRGGGGRKDSNSSPLVYPTHVKTTIIFNENFV